MHIHRHPYGCVYVYTHVHTWRTSYTYMHTEYMSYYVLHRPKHPCARPWFIFPHCSGCRVRWSTGTSVTFLLCTKSLMRFSSMPPTIYKEIQRWRHAQHSRLIASKDWSYPQRFLWNNWQSCRQSKWTSTNRKARMNFKPFVFMVIYTWTCESNYVLWHMVQCCVGAWACSAALNKTHEVNP